MRRAEKPKSLTMQGSANDSPMSFWEHLDELRAVFFRVTVVVLAFMAVAFVCKDELFAIILAPKYDGFVTYRVLERVAEWLPGGEDGIHFDIRLINTGLAQQFVIHMKAALYAGLVVASPYILYQLFRFVSPALYVHERRYALRVAGSGYLMFMAGVALCYFLIFPLTFRFLGTYQVSGEVENLITLESYMDTLLMMSLMMGIVFEIPILCWLFAKLGFLSEGYMRRYRKHALVAILVVAAVITPTSDIFTLTLVSLPMYLLYELSIVLVRHTNRVQNA